MLFLSVYTCVSCQRDNFILRQAWKMHLLVLLFEAFGDA